MKQQQEMYWDEEAQQFYMYESQGAAPGGHGGKTAIYIVAYFLVLAIMMVPAQHLHVGMQGIFFAMVVAGVLLGLAILLFKVVRTKIASMKLSRKGFAQIMVGFQPEVLDDAPATETTGRELTLASPTALVALDDDDTDDGPPDQIIERDPLLIASDFQPSVHSFIGSMSLLCGIRRSGKSNLLAVLVEELARYGVPMIIFDTEDEYASLVDKKYLPRGVHVGDPRDERNSPCKGMYVGLDQSGAYEFGRSVLDGQLQVVINLKSWSDDDAAVIMAEMIDGLNDWEEERDNSDRIPVMLFLDEAQKWLPQNLKDGYVTRENQTLLHHAFFDIVVARGGKRGFGLACATQRYSQLNKNVLQSQWKFLLKQTEMIDVANYVKQGLDADEVVAMQQGECYIFSPLVIGFKTTIRKRYSPHMSNTPGLANLEKYKRSLSLPAFTRPLSHAQNEQIHTPAQERVNEPVERVNAVNMAVNIREYSPAPENAVNANLAVTPEVRETILRAIITMQAAGVKLTRTGLRDHLGWDNREYTEVLKPALDEMGLLK